MRLTNSTTGHVIDFHIDNDLPDGWGEIFDNTYTFIKRTTLPPAKEDWQAARYIHMNERDYLHAAMAADVVERKRQN